MVVKHNLFDLRKKSRLLSQITACGAAVQDIWDVRIGQSTTGHEPGISFQLKILRPGIIIY